MTNWEYALITYSTGGLTGSRVYGWVYQEGKIVQLKGYTGAEPLLQALTAFGSVGWEAVSGTNGSHAAHPGVTMVIILKRPAVI